MRTLEEKRVQIDENMERVDAMLTNALKGIKNGDISSGTLQSLALTKIALEMSSENLRKEENNAGV